MVLFSLVYYADTKNGQITDITISNVRYRWYRYRYRHLSIERGIDTLNRYRDEVSKSIDS